MLRRLYAYKIIKPDVLAKLEANERFYTRRSDVLCKAIRDSYRCKFISARNRVLEAFLEDSINENIIVARTEAYQIREALFAKLKPAEAEDYLEESDYEESGLPVPSEERKDAVKHDVSKSRTMDAAWAGDTLTANEIQTLSGCDQALLGGGDYFSVTTEVDAVIRKIGNMALETPIEQLCP